MSRGRSVRKQRESSFSLKIPAEDDRLTVAYAVETARPGEYSGHSAEEQLESFADSASACFDRLHFDVAAQLPEVLYQAIDAARMRLAWRPKGTSSIREINGKPIPDIEDNAQWPLLDTPYITQEVDGDLTLQTDKGAVKYDFSNWEIRGAPAR